MAKLPLAKQTGGRAIQGVAPLLTDLPVPTPSPTPTTIRPFGGRQNSKVRTQLSFEGINKTKIVVNQHTIIFNIGGLQKCKIIFVHIQSLNFPDHMHKTLRKRVTQVNIQSCTPPILNLLLF